MNNRATPPEPPCRRSHLLHWKPTFFFNRSKFVGTSAPETIFAAIMTFPVTFLSIHFNFQGWFLDVRVWIHTCNKHSVRYQKKKEKKNVLICSVNFYKWYVFKILSVFRSTQFFFSQTTFINSEYKLFFFSRLSSYLLWTTKSGQLTVSPNIFRRPLKLFANMLTFECFSLFGLRSATKQKRTLLKKKFRSTSQSRFFFKFVFY
jgi:hypothetical protein